MRFLPHLVMAMSVPAAMAAVKLGAGAVLPVLFAFSLAAIAAQILASRAKQA